MPDFLISIAPSGRRKKLAGASCGWPGSQNLCVTVALEWPFGFSEDEDDAARRCLSVLAVRVVLKPCELQL